ncbi:MAG TPA: flagellar biosynthetic protein FliR [Paracoccaceae bacterium]|nr:flagellar biosynthetic protein FliR [Paracoccaceae bacterium]
MNDLAALLVELARGQLLLAGLVFLRVGAAIALLPAFGDRLVPARIRLGLALALTAVVAPSVASEIVAPDGGVGDYTLFLVAETANGLALGIVLRLFILALEMAGGLAAQSGSLSQMFGTSGEPMPAMAHLLVMAGLALAVLSGLHVQIARALILSYAALPAGQFPAAALMRDWGVAQTGAAFALTFSLAAPFVIAGLIYNVALGLINRAMPMLMVSFVGAPALTAGTLILLAVSTPLILSAWQGAFAMHLADPFTVPR